MKSKDKLKIGDKVFTSRLFTGTGKFGSLHLMKESLLASGSQLVTVALKRVDINKTDENILVFLSDSQFNLLPNTSGVTNRQRGCICCKRGKGSTWHQLVETGNTSRPQISYA